MPLDLVKAVNHHFLPIGAGQATTVSEKTDLDFQAWERRWLLDLTWPLFWQEGLARQDTWFF